MVEGVTLAICTTCARSAQTPNPLKGLSIARVIGGRQDSGHAGAADEQVSLDGGAHVMPRFRLSAVTAKQSIAVKPRS